MRDLKKVVARDRVILEDITLAFLPGAKIGVLGANGAGKSSLLHIMAGLDDEFGRLQKSPAESGGVSSQSAYIIVEDADAHYARAVGAGAEIVIEIKDEDYGGRGYSCRDPEGHVWNFGTYDPWASS